MIRKLTILTALAMVLCGCKESETGGPVGPATSAGVFTVDALTVNGWVLVDSVTGGSTGRFGYSLNYHFEGYPGTIDTIRFTINQATGLMLRFNQEVPDSIGTRYSHSPVYGMGQLLGNTDSLVVLCEIMGRFWIVRQDNVTSFDRFAWSKISEVAVQRQ